MNPSDNSTYATGKPLQGQSKEGFWGHMNPLARKKWVNRQVTPIKDQVNELDQLQAKNANDIKDVDSRAQAGIKNAMNSANTADQHAQDAANRANAANQLASNASTRTDFSEYDGRKSGSVPDGVFDLGEVCCGTDDAWTDRQV